MKFLTRTQELLIKVLISLSFPFFTIILSSGHRQKAALIGAAFSFIISIFIVKKIKINNIKINNFIISNLISFFMVKEWLIKMKEENYNLEILKYAFKTIKFDTSINNMYSALGLLAIPANIFIVYLFIEKIFPIVKRFIYKLNKTEKIYLTTMSILGIIISLIVNFKTTAFAIPLHDNHLACYDAIYTADSGYLTYENGFFNVSINENDIRQPLFGVFSLPFSVPAKIISQLAFFVPQNISFSFAMMLFQFIIMSTTIVLLSRMININEKNIKYFYIFASSTYIYMIFNLIIEQYVISTFYLILAIYYNYKNSNKTNYIYAATVGTLITSGIIFPLIGNIKKMKEWIKSVIKVFVSFVTVFIIGGQLPQIYNLLSNFNKVYGNFTGKTTLIKRIYQYSYFIKGIFIANPGKEVKRFGLPSYQNIDFKTLSIIGIVILIITIIGYIINRKEKIARISILWVLFSIIILIGLGYGSYENGFVLYGLYFGWAYISLIFMFFNKVIKNRKLFIIIILLLCGIMLYNNFTEILNILNFAIKNYKTIIY